MRRVLFAALLAAALGMFAWTLRRFTRLIRAGRPEPRFDRAEDRVDSVLRYFFAQTDKEEGVETRCAVINDIAPALSNPAVQSVIRAAAQSAGLTTSDMPSGAVHDAGEISRLAPMGMIFVPSRDGISHAPQEFSTWDDVANGTEVLYRSILKLDKQMNAR